MSDSTARTHLRVVPAPKRPPPPGRDAWPLGWLDYTAGIPRPAALANPALTADLVGPHGRFTVPAETARTAVAAYEDGWYSAAADPADAHHPPQQRRSAHGATDRAIRERGPSGSSRVVVVPSGAIDSSGDELIRLAGAIRGSITAGYRLHHFGRGSAWLLRIGLAAREDIDPDARPVALTIAGVAHLGGIVLHRIGEDPDTAGHGPALAMLTKAVLQDWHTPSRLRYAARTARSGRSAAVTESTFAPTASPASVAAAAGHSIASHAPPRRNSRTPPASPPGC